MCKFRGGVMDKLTGEERGKLLVKTDAEMQQVWDDMSEEDKRECEKATKMALEVLVTRYYMEPKSENFASWGIGNELSTFQVTVQRVEGITPAQRIQQLEAVIKDLEKEVAHQQIILQEAGEEMARMGKLLPVYAGADGSTCQCDHGSTEHLYWGACKNCDCMGFKE